jgi:hypothetical protein
MQLTSRGPRQSGVRVPEAGRPPRPLVLVVCGGDTFRFLPL